MAERMAAISAVLYGQRSSVRLDSVTVFYLGSSPSEYHLELKETRLTGPTADVKSYRSDGLHVPASYSGIGLDSQVPTGSKLYIPVAKSSGAELSFSGLYGLSFESSSGRSVDFMQDGLHPAYSKKSLVSNLVFPHAPPWVFGDDLSSSLVYRSSSVELGLLSIGVQSSQIASGRSCMVTISTPYGNINYIISSSERNLIASLITSDGRVVFDHVVLSNSLLDCAASSGPYFSTFDDNHSGQSYNLRNNRFTALTVPLNYGELFAWNPDLNRLHFMSVTHVMLPSNLFIQQVSVMTAVIRDDSDNFDVISERQLETFPVDENIFVKTVVVSSAAVYFVSNSTHFSMHSDVFGKHVLLLPSVLDVWLLQLFGRVYVFVSHGIMGTNVQFSIYHVMQENMIRIGSDY